MSGELHCSTTVALGKESLVHNGGWVVPELGWAVKRGWSEKLLHKDTIQFGFPYKATFHGHF